MARVGAVAIVVLFLAAFAAGQVGTTPGLQATIGSDFVGRAWKELVTIALPMLQGLALPEMNGSASTPIGTIDYDITGLTITSVSFGSSSVNLTSGSGVVATVSGLALSITLDIKFRQEPFPHISGTDKVTVKVTSGDAQFGMNVTETSGHLQLALTSDTLSLGDFNVSITGTWAWLVDVIKGLFNSKIKSAVVSGITGALQTTLVPELNTALMQLPMTHTFLSDEWAITLDYSLVQSPTVNDNYLSANILGGFTSAEKPAPCPSVAPAMPLSAGTNDVQVFISDAVLDCLSFAFFNAGNFKYVLDHSIVPATSIVQMNTSTFVSLFPQLYEKYPDVFFDVGITATEAPKLTSSKTGEGVLVNGGATLSFMPVVDGNETDALTLDAEVELLLSILPHQVDSSVGHEVYVSGALTINNLTLTADSSLVGPVDTAGLVRILTDIFGVVDAALTVGVPLPHIPLPYIGEFDISSPFTQYNDGFTIVAFDLSF